MPNQPERTAGLAPRLRGAVGTGTLLALLLAGGCNSASSPPSNPSSMPPSSPSSMPSGAPGTPGSTPPARPSSSPPGSSGSSGSNSPGGSQNSSQSGSQSGGGVPGGEQSGNQPPGGAGGMPEGSAQPKGSGLPGSGGSGTEQAGGAGGGRPPGSGGEEGWESGLPGGSGDGWETSNQIPGGGESRIPPMPSERGKPPGSGDGELDGALEDFDGEILAEREVIRQRSNESAGAGTGGLPGVGAEASEGVGGPGGTADVPTRGGPLGIPSNRNTPPPPSPVASAGVPDDIPDAKDDDIIARQLREAAMQESDPVLKEKLWDEYRRYKGI